MAGLLVEVRRPTVQGEARQLGLLGLVLKLRQNNYLCRLLHLLTLSTLPAPDLLVILASYKCPALKMASSVAVSGSHIYLSLPQAMSIYPSDVENSR